MDGHISLSMGETQIGLHELEEIKTNLKKKTQILVSIIGQCDREVCRSK